MGRQNMTMTQWNQAGLKTRGSEKVLKSAVRRVLACNWLWKYQEPQTHQANEKDDFYNRIKHVYSMVQKMTSVWVISFFYRCYDQNLTQSESQKLLIRNRAVTSRRLRPFIIRSMSEICGLKVFLFFYSLIQAVVKQRRDRPANKWQRDVWRGCYSCDQKVRLQTEWEDQYFLMSETDLCRWISNFFSEVKIISLFQTLACFKSLQQHSKREKLCISYLGVRRLVLVIEEVVLTHKNHIFTNDSDIKFLEFCKLMLWKTTKGIREDNVASLPNLKSDAQIILIHL